ncbi:ABC transporter permease [Terriglobus albidus]|uniref:ABC transporter permease n=1 Tax=Terriglobus albidus TaxID=1592106 RepID=A0A5B9EFJ1_9BACT|nr:ABC transporter permease [Terriglobus albidus]QEE29211.1 ABC transporter permease [Terriglobus albidus]
MRSSLGMACAILLTIFILSGVFAPLLAPYDPLQLNLDARLQAPAIHHWFGTDELGRDILSRCIYGARISLSVATSVVILSLFLGLLIGSLAGFYGGWLDTVLNVYLINAFMAIPGILLAIAFVAFSGPGFRNLVAALSLTMWTGFARLVRAQVAAAAQMEYVEAARALGASDLRIIARHILPNVLQPVLVQAALGLATAVLAEATLSFLGLGTPPPAPSWGNMLNDARSHLFDSPHMVIFPALSVMICVVAFNFLGDILRDTADPRRKVRRSAVPLEA